jgi:hypothetical protein
LQIATSSQVGLTAFEALQDYALFIPNFDGKRGMIMSNERCVSAYSLKDKVQKTCDHLTLQDVIRLRRKQTSITETMEEKNLAAESPTMKLKNYPTERRGSIIGLLDSRKVRDIWIDPSQRFKSLIDFISFAYEINETFEPLRRIKGKLDSSSYNRRYALFIIERIFIEIFNFHCIELVI